MMIHFSKRQITFTQFTGFCSANYQTHFGLLIIFMFYDMKLCITVYDKGNQRIDQIIQDALIILYFPFGPLRSARVF